MGCVNISQVMQHTTRGASFPSPHILLLLQDGGQQHHLLVWDLTQVARQEGLLGVQWRGWLRGNRLSSKQVQHVQMDDPLGQCQAKM